MAEDIMKTGPAKIAAATATFKQVVRECIEARYANSRVTAAHVMGAFEESMRKVSQDLIREFR